MRLAIFLLVLAVFLGGAYALRTRVISATSTRRLAAVLGFLAVALGAVGAHALKARLAPTGGDLLWEKGVLYHLFHALALLALSARTRIVLVPVLCFAAGIVLFSG